MSVPPAIESRGLTRILIEELLRAEGIEYEAVEERAKAVSSFEEKIQREGKAYACLERA